MPEGAGRRPYLLLDGVDDEPLLLAPGSEATTASGYSYRFVGRADGAGINVKRDPGDTFIFIAVVLALAGLAMTFYIPRRRLWARISGDRVQLAGIAGRATRLDRELRRLGTELGARDSGAAVDTEERW
jgi:cytochrome c biogenesis protein